MKKIEKFDWKLTIKLNILMLKITGLWPEGDDTYKFNFYTFYAIISNALFVFGHVFFQTCNIFFIFEDLQALTGTTFILISEMMIAIKTYCLVKNMRKLKKLMITLNSDLFQPKNVEQRNLVQPSLNLWKTIYNFFYFMAVAAIFFWSSFPILDNSVKEHRLPFLAWYPYNFKKSPFYEVTYLYQIVSIGFLAIVNGNIDTLVAALNMYTGTQFDILCDDLRNLQSSDRDALTDMNKRLVNCIMHHREILSFSEDSTFFFNWIIFLQIFASAVAISLTMFHLTVLSPLSNEFFSSLSYGNTVLVQIFMYCWFGNEVEVKSNKVSYAAFESDWTSASQDVKKNLLFFIVRTQKPLKIAAMNMFHLSLENFVKILRAGWSYFVVLHQVNSTK